MQKAEVQHDRAQNQPAQRQGNGAALESPQGEQIAQLEAMADASPQAGRLAQLAAMANNSPRMVAQRKAVEGIDNSLRVTAQRQQIDSLTGETAQREESEEPLQPQVAQREESPEKPNASTQLSTGSKPNHTGLPDNLKSGVENLSGMSMDNVKVHYNSSQPAQLNALAYAQGTDIHVAPGQEQHLPHEAWHVVQQAQGRVKPTMQMKQGVPVNDDKLLEHEADVMGEKASQWLPVRTASESNLVANALQKVKNDSPVQLKTTTAVKQELRTGALLANFVMTFITHHLGTGKNDNVSAAEVHARRQNQPQRNTVIMDARALKDALVAGTWVDSGDHWTVTTATAIELQGTRKRPGNIGEVPEGATLLGLTGSGEHAGKFTVSEGAITAIESATAEEVQNAVAATGPYPSGNGARVKSQRRDYRQGLVDHINEQRRKRANDEKVTWVKQYFRSIGGTNMYGNNGITTIDNINGVERTTQNVTVFVGKNSGDIYHFDA